MPTSSFNEKFKITDPEVAERFCEDLAKSSDTKILEAFNDLAKKQEPLGDEFQKVLYDNLGDLYVTDEGETT